MMIDIYFMYAGCQFFRYFDCIHCSRPAIIQGVTEGKYGMVLFTPEMFLMKKCQCLLKSPPCSCNLKGIVTDEVHTLRSDVLMFF